VSDTLGEKDEVGAWFHVAQHQPNHFDGQMQVNIAEPGVEQTGTALQTREVAIDCNHKFVTFLPILPFRGV